MIRYLSLAEVLDLHDRVISQTGGSHGLRDLGMLESAAAGRRSAPLRAGRRHAHQGAPSGGDPLDQRPDRGARVAIAVLRLPDRYRRRLRTANTLERLIQELRRREKVIHFFPNDESAWRRLGTFLAETHEDWSTGRRYFRMDDHFRWRQQQQTAEDEIQPAV